MSADPITSGLNLADDVVKGASQWAFETQTRRLTDANTQALADVNRFRDLLLAGDDPGMGLMLDELHDGVDVDLTPAQSAFLSSVRVRLTGAEYLGFYCRARAAKLAVDREQIVRDTASTLKG